MISMCVCMNTAYRGPSADYANSSSDSRFLLIVAILCQASQGSVGLVDALRQIRKQVGAEVTAICRADLSTPHRPAKVLCDEKHCSRSEDVGTFGVSFAMGVCGENIKSAKAGSVWVGTFADFENRERLASIYRHRRLVSTIVIPLQRRNGYGDFLELHFSHPISAAFVGHLELLGPVLANCWKDRSPGLLVESSLSRRQICSGRISLGAILSTENPYRLSRAEYRVCMMLSRGLNNEAVLSELSITIATLRTHLRNIYAKTDCASQPELIHKLLSVVAASSTGWGRDADVA